MTVRDQSDSDLRGLSGWLAAAAIVAYWWFMLRAMRRLLASIAEGGQWLREWREEDRGGPPRPRPRAFGRRPGARSGG
jgi:hypothetical protein